MSYSQGNVYSKSYNFKRYYTYLYVNGIREQNVDSTYILRIPLTVCGFRLQLRIPQQLNSIIRMSLFVDSSNCSGFRNFAYFWSDFEKYSVLGVCLWNPKQQRRSNKRIPDQRNESEDQRNERAMLRIPRQFCFLPVAETAYNAQNAQFGLVMSVCAANYIIVTFFAGF